MPEHLGTLRTVMILEWLSSSLQLMLIPVIDSLATHQMYLLSLWIAL